MVLVKLTWGYKSIERVLTAAIRVVASFIIDIGIEMVRQTAVQFLLILFLLLLFALALTGFLWLRCCSDCMSRISCCYNLADSVKVLGVVVVVERLFVELLLRETAIFSLRF
jgi:hypothetical protein